MKAFTLTGTLTLSCLLLSTGATTTNTATFSDLTRFDEIGNYYHHSVDTKLRLTSNGTHTFNYTLMHPNGTAEVNHHVVVPLPPQTANKYCGPPPPSREQLETQDGSSNNNNCLNEQLKIEGAGRPVDQGAPVIMNNGYLTAEHCKTLGKGTMYACRIKCPDNQGGDGCYNEECLNVDDAAALNMTGGFCYDYDG